MGTAEPAVDDEFLRDFFRQLGLGALEPDDHRYVSLYGETHDPVERLATTIEWSPDPSTQLVMGYRGTGKTTELKRLARRLDKAGYRAHHIDVEAYLNTAIPIDVIDYLLFVGGALSDAVDPDESSPGFWGRIKERLGEWGVEGASLGVPGGLATVDLKRNLKYDPSFLERLRASAAGHLGKLVAEVRSFVEELPGADAGSVVVLIDSTDHYQGSTLNDEDVQASVQALFTNHADKLKLPVHTVYTVPPYLKARSKSITSYYGGGTLTVIPAVKVRDIDTDTPDAGAVATLTEVVSARGEWSRLLPVESLEHLVCLSGGHLRDLLRLLAELTRRCRGRPIPPGRSLVDDVVLQTTNEMLPIADHDARWLARIDRDHSAGLTDVDDIPAPARFLEQGLVLSYLNGGEWYDVHPLVRDHVRAQVARLDEGGAQPGDGSDVRASP